MFNCPPDPPRQYEYDEQLVSLVAPPQPGPVPVQDTPVGHHTLTHLPGERGEVRGERSEVRSERSEARSERSEARSERCEVRAES